MNKIEFLQKRPWLLHLLLMLGISMVLLFLIFLFIRIYARQGDEYELPDIVGMNIAEVEADNALGFRYVVQDSIFRPGNPGGIILTQDPKCGTMVKKGRKVYGGGGIQPDVTLPYILDTNWVYYNRLLDKQVLEDVLQKDLYNNYSQLVEQYPDADAFVKNYKVPEQTWQRILLCADKKGIRRHPGALNKYADHIRNRYKSLMAQSLFDENAFYRVYVPYDNELQRALHAKQK